MAPGMLYLNMYPCVFFPYGGSNRKKTESEVVLVESVPNCGWNSNLGLEVLINFPRLIQKDIHTSLVHPKTCFVKIDV